MNSHSTPAIDQAVRHDREKQCRHHRHQRHQQRKDRRGQKRRAVKLVEQQEFEIAEADELGRQAERIGDEERLPDRLPGRVKEKDRGNQQLWKDQRQRQQPALECNQFLHRSRAQEPGR
jgi:hypothetical protein